MGRRTLAAETVAASSEDRDALPERLLEDAEGDDIFRLRRDAVAAARALQGVAPPPAPVDVGRDGLLASPLLRAAALAAVAGLVAGLVLAYVLAHTAFDPAVQCHTYAGGTFTCVREPTR
jgi:hypothetical protein